jgi:hypothetical protein
MSKLVCEHNAQDHEKSYLPFLQKTTTVGILLINISNCDYHLANETAQRMITGSAV